MFMALDLLHQDGVDLCALPCPTIEDRRVCGELGEGLGHARQPVGVCSTVAREEAHASAILGVSKSEAIPLGLLKPVVAPGFAVNRSLDASAPIV